MKYQGKILSGLLVAVVALGLGGCASNNSATTHKSSNEPTSAKVVKQSNHKKDSNKAAKEVKNSTNVSQNAVSEESSPAASSSQYVAAQATTSGQTTAVSRAAVPTTNAVSQPAQSGSSYTNSATQTPVVAPSNPQTGQTTTNDDQYQVPNEYYYYWVWTDSQGRTHNVDWDLTDRITTTDGQILYNDSYNEPQPEHATQYDSREFNLHYDGTDQWVINFDNQIQAKPDNGVVNQY